MVSLALTWRIAPAVSASQRVPLLAFADPPLIARVLALIDVGPVQVLTPFKTSVPVPFWMTAPVPAITEAKSVPWATVLERLYWSG